MNTYQTWDLVIIGAGVTGAAAAYAAALATDAGRIMVVEKYPQPGLVNSHSKNNSQTLHRGDTESNYNLAKAEQVKCAAELVRTFVEAHKDVPGLHQVTSRLLLGVGDAEVKLIRQRYEDFRELYPELELLDRDGLARVEPLVVQGRPANEPVTALYSPLGYAVNFQWLAEALLHEAKWLQRLKGVGQLEIEYNAPVKTITRHGRLFHIATPSGTVKARSIIVATGGYSLGFARELGYGQDLAILPVAGSFFFTPKVLKGKVYTVQQDSLPFAAIHGDPDITDATGTLTRFGPTAKVLPLLERHRYRSVWPFLRLPLRTIDGVLTLIKLVRDPVVARFMGLNLFYDLPLVGRWLFLRQARKIVPSLRLRDIKLGRGLGGLRPQVVNVREHTMPMGETTLYGDDAVFITTPSPGASTCLAVAEACFKHLSKQGVFHFDQSKFDAALRLETTAPTAG